MSSIFNTEDLYVVISAFYAISIPEFHMHTHTHESCEIMYVTGGSCEVQCQGEEIHLGQNQFVFIDAQVPHKLVIPEGHPCSVLNIEFQRSSEEGMIDLSPLQKNSPDFQKFCKQNNPFLVSADLRSLGYALKDLITHLQKENRQEDYLTNILFQRMVLELAYCVNQNKQSAGMYYLRKACSYIEENLCESMKVPEIAAYTGINKSYLQLLFSRFLHCTIVDYVNQKRMERAVFYLTNSTSSVTDIAFAIGYNSRQHFAHTFEKYFGMSPLKYRKLHSRTLVPDTGEVQYVLEKESKVKEIYLGRKR